MFGGGDSSAGNFDEAKAAKALRVPVEEFQRRVAAAKEPRVAQSATDPTKKITVKSSAQMQQTLLKDAVGKRQVAGRRADMSAAMGTVRYARWVVSAASVGVFGYLIMTLGLPFLYEMRRRQHVRQVRLSNAQRQREEAAEARKE